MSAADARGRAGALTAAAMLGFATNSVLCRLALRGGSIDAAGFTAIRLVSGAALLYLLFGFREGGLSLRPRTHARSALALFVYAAAFSFAYLRLDAGTGALILFGMVQLTMLVAARIEGQHLHARQLQGLAVCASGLVALTFPGLGPADPIGALLMALSGIAWGMYSLYGRGVDDPRLGTARNFVLSVPLALALPLLDVDALRLSTRGAALAVASGALASALGYVLWYAALRHLRAFEAAIVQLSVPVLAAVGGALVVDEPLTMRAMAAGGAILGGIAWGLTAPRTA